MIQQFQGVIEIAEPYIATPALTCYVPPLEMTRVGQKDHISLLPDILPRDPSPFISFHPLKISEYNEPLWLIIINK